MIEIRCVGQDHLIHVCKPWDKVTKCGVKVINKKPTKQDLAGKFSCYECTY